MAVTLAPNQAPKGTRPGSSIVVVDTFTDSANTKASISIPIPIAAQPGDLIMAYLSLGALGTGHGITASQMVPAGAMTTRTNVIDGSPSTNTIQTVLFDRVVQKGDAGTTIEFQFTCNVFVSWGLTVRTLRYVNTNSFYDTITTNASLGDINTGTPTNPVTATVPNSLIISCLGAVGGTGGLGLTHGPVTAWNNGVDAGTGQQPNLGQVSGLIDMPIPAQWQGASCLWDQAGANQFVDFAAISAVVKPVQAPAVPGVTLSPSGSSIDAAGLSGIPFGVTIKYTPTGGQGPQQAWYHIRQVHGGSTQQFWNADLNIWQTAEYANYGTQKTYYYPSGAWVDDGTNWDLYVAVMESALGYKSTPALAGTFTADPPPALVVTSPIGQTFGTDPISWLPVLSAGYAETGYQVRVYSSDQYDQAGFNPAGLLDDDTAYPSAAGGGGGWTADLNCTVVPGGFGIRMTAIANGNMFARSFASQASPGGNLTALTGVGLFPCKPGDSITSFQWIAAATTTRTVNAAVEWFDANGTWLHTDFGPNITDATTAVQAIVTATAPAGAAFFMEVACVFGVVIGEQHYMQSTGAFKTALAPRAASAMINGTATTWTPPALRGGAYYRAYVRIMQTGAQLSPFAHTDWYADYANQTAPLLAIVPGNDPITGAPVARATVTAQDPYSLQGTTFVNLWRYDAVEQDYTPVRYCQGVPVLWPTPYQLANGLSAADADFETGVGNWLAYGGASVAQSTVVAYTGTHSLAITCSGAGGQGAGIHYLIYPATAGQAWVITGQIRADAAAASGRVVNAGLQFFDGAGTVLSDTPGATVTDSKTAWTQLTPSSARGPVGTAWVGGYVSIVGAAAGEKHYIDTNVLAPCLQPVTLVDFEMPPNQPVDYQVQVYSTSPTGP